MLDRATIHLFAPLMERWARVLVDRGISANLLTVLGFGLGLTGAALVALGTPVLGLALMLLSRLCDGLDGAVARLTHPTDLGGFLDIALDFLFYASVPLAFAVTDPSTNALPAAVLLSALMGSGTTFLAFAVLATKRGLTSLNYPGRSLFFLGGVVESTETFGMYATMCLWPVLFAPLAYALAATAVLTTVTRLLWGWKVL